MPAFFCSGNCAALFPGSLAADAAAKAGRRKAAPRAAARLAGEWQGRGRRAENSFRSG